jgi:hypothetical protein
MLHKIVVPTSRQNSIIFIEARNQIRGSGEQKSNDVSD